MHNIAVKAPQRLRVLAVVSRFKWQHIDYLAALRERFDFLGAHVGEAHAGSVRRARFEGLPLVTLSARQNDVEGARPGLDEILKTFAPDVVHVLYYHNEGLTLLARGLAPPQTLVVHECRDPLTTLSGQVAPERSLERLALERSDGQIVVSRAVRTHLECLHGIDLSERSLVVPHGFALKSAGPPTVKLSASDGATHIALVGTADRGPGQGRYYIDIIDRLIALGFIVHSHFHEDDENHIYREHAKRNPRYHCHATVSFRDGTRLSDLMSRYDLMGVFHDLDAKDHNESATLAVCMPTKAVCGWLHGGIPVVCFRHYGGLVERIEEHGIGFVADSWDDVAALSDRHREIAEATTRTLAVREQFSNEWNAVRIETFFRTLLGRV
jgi:hypothetical protein